MKQERLDENRAAQMLAAMGSVARLRVFKALISAGEGGLNVTELQRLCAMPPTTLAHHLSKLAQAGLIDQERQGRELVNRARFVRVRALSTYLMDECCSRAVRRPPAIG